MSRGQLQQNLILIVNIYISLITLTYAADKWSRQVDSVQPDVVNDNFDWVPLAQKSNNDDDSSGDTVTATVKDRTPNARVLTYSQSFPINNHFVDATKAFNNAAISQRPIPFDFTFAQFPQQSSLRQPRPLMKVNSNANAHAIANVNANANANANGRHQEGAAQTFLKFDTPFGRTGNNRPISDLASAINNNYQIQHAFGGGAQATLFSSPVYSQQPIFPPEFHPMPQKPVSQLLHQKPLQQANVQVQKLRQTQHTQQIQQTQQPHQQNVLDESLSLGDFFKSKKPTSSPLQAINSQIFPTNPSVNNYQYNAIPTASAPSAPSATSSLRPLISNQHQQQLHSQLQSQQQQTRSQPEIQVLYVPFESLYGNQQQQQPQEQQHRVTFGQQLNTYDNVGHNVPIPTINPFQVNQFYTPEPILSSASYIPTTTTTTTRTTTTTTVKPQSTTLRRPANIYEDYLNTLNTTPKPKQKAHQPALAMFVLNSSSRPSQADVVDRLRNDKIIAVVDSPNQAIPEIFVGPAGMPTPFGYSKFELPYLSQLQGIYNLREMAFFVAPMSYRTPAGFSKIFLPEPHVGSIVINLNKGNQPASVSTQSPYQVLPKLPANPYYSLQLQNQTTEYPPTSTTTTSTTTVKPHTSSQNFITHRPVIESNAYFQTFDQNNLNNYKDYSTTASPRTTTSQRIKANQRENKYNYYYDQDSVSEISSSKSSTKDRTKKKRPQYIEQEQINYSQQPQPQNPYAQFNPIPNQIRDMSFFKVSNSRPSTTSFTSTTMAPTTTATATPPPQTYFAYNTSPDVDYHSTRGHLNPKTNQIFQGEHHQAILSTPTQSSQFYGNPALLRNNQFVQPNAQSNESTASPASSITADEEYRMKQYYRQQDAYRNRPKVIYQTTPEYEQEHYTPVDFDYAIAKNKVKDTTTSGTRTTSTTTTTTTTIKPRIIFYSPTPAAQFDNDTITLPNQEFSNQYNNLPTNHRPTYDQNEVTEGPIEYEPNPYELPSELPPLTPNLPGLVNDLLEKNKQNSTELGVPVRKEEEPTIKPTRRPVNRLRKPVSTKVSSSVSYSESESTSRRPSTRVRRPFGVKASTHINADASGNSNVGDKLSATSSGTTTKRPSFSRNPLARNPNRIRYQPTPEERETLRIKTRRKYKGSSKKPETEDLDYQRDVLNQNYPVIKPTLIPKQKNAPEESPVTKTTTEVPVSELQQIFTVTPHNSIDHEQSYAGSLLEPMQIAQQYNHYTDNYGPGYFPNQEDFSPTEPYTKNEVHPIYTTGKPEEQELYDSTTTTTKITTTTEPKIVETTTRRSPFLRRNYNRLRTTTTTEAPTTEQPVTEEKPLISFHIKNRVPLRKPLRLRPRNKRPLYTTTPSPLPVDEDAEKVEETQTTYQKLNRYSDEPTEDDIHKRRYKTRFHLDAQESQWSSSAKLGPTNNFKPINPKEYPSNPNKFENEPRIITAEPKSDNDNYEIEVTANYEGSKRRISQPSLRPERTFAELLEEVMGKPIVEQEQEQEVSNAKSILTEIGDFESQKTSADHRPNRRGKWKKVRVSPVTSMQKENLETAESQNWSSQTYSAINNNTEKSVDITTTSETPHSYSDTTNLPTESSKATNDIDTSSIKPEISTTTLNVLNIINREETSQDESATRRMDTFPNDEGLDAKSTLFSEVKKQLHNLFSIEDTDDSAVTAALAASSKRRQEYQQIVRTKSETTAAPITTEASSFNNNDLIPSNEQHRQQSQQSQQSQQQQQQQDKFHKNLMEQVVYATSQTMTEQTSEAEICYRGRCIKSDELPPNHKLN